MITINQESEEYRNFLAMREFIYAFWLRGGKSSDGIANLLSAIDILSDGLPLDRAMWGDWLEALDKVVGAGK